MRFPFALRSTVDSLRAELYDLKGEHAWRGHALRKIAAGQTEYANATVKRLCKIARDALRDRR